MGVPRSLSGMALGFLLAPMLYGCATMPAEEQSGGIVPFTGPREKTCCSMAVGTPKQEALVRAAVEFLGQPRIYASGKRFTFDCSGLARAVYVSQGVDLYDGLGKLDGGNGVGRIYAHVLQHGRIHYGPTVHPGDLVFFHNTWDFNRDDRLDDPLTHVGVVEGVESDGTVVFVSVVSAGVERYRMNLKAPDMQKASDGRVLNDYMRRKMFGDSQVPYLSGQLFAAFGTLE